MSESTAAINHTEVTEVYYMVSGSGTLLTGGTVENSKAAPADSEIVKVGCRSEQQRHLQGAGTEAQARGRRHGDHSRRGLSWLHGCRGSYRIRFRSLGSEARAAGWLRQSAPCKARVPTNETAKG